MIFSFSIRCMFIIPLILSSGLTFISSSAFAQDSMELIATIVIERDSTNMTSMMPIGDFNADGYPDLAIGVRQDPLNIYEAVYIYYGGPAFDTDPDLIIPGEPQNQNGYCDGPGEAMTFFGGRIISLTDFNGDGNDDIAVSAYHYCPNTYREGRLYIYFGSPDPDTVVDVVIDGYQYYENLGEYIGAGDFNGDSFGDLLALAPWPPFEDSKAYIYFGSDSPNSTCDWQRTFTNQELYHRWWHSGFDLNNDGFDEFTIRINDHPEYYYAVFLGGESIEQEPHFQIDQSLAFVSDISHDGIDDALMGEDMRIYLCMGGDPLDFEPDYYVGNRGHVPFTYSLFGEGTKLMLDNTNERSLIMYNAGVPFDSIPRNIFDYTFYSGLYKHNIGDINADGIEDLALLFWEDTLGSFVNVYSIFTTNILEEDGRGLLPKDQAMLYCYPNPFNSDVLLNAANYDGLDVEIRIYDIVGRLVQTIHTIEGKATWDATDNSGRKVSSGIYFARAKTSRNFNTIKLLYLK